MAERQVAFEWRARATPLAPAAMAAVGEAARVLGGRLLHRDDEALGRLEGVCGEHLLLLIGAEADLPWVDGVTYLGRDPAAPALLLPTAIEPSVHPRLLERALAPLPPPVVVIPGAAFSAALAGHVARDVLRKWLAAAEAAAREASGG